MNKKLVNVVGNALFSALIGLFAGLALGLIIWGVTKLIQTDPHFDMPREAAAFLGMGFGTVVGAVFGGVLGMKEK